MTKTHRGHMVRLHPPTPVAAAATIGPGTKRQANTHTRVHTHIHTPNGRQSALLRPRTNAWICILHLLLFLSLSPTHTHAHTSPWSLQVHGALKADVNGLEKRHWVAMGGGDLFAQTDCAKLCTLSSAKTIKNSYKITRFIILLNH